MSRYGARLLVRACFRHPVYQRRLPTQWVRCFSRKRGNIVDLDEEDFELSSMPRSVVQEAADGLEKTPEELEAEIVESEMEESEMEETGDPETSKKGPDEYTIEELHAMARKLGAINPKTGERLEEYPEELKKPPPDQEVSGDDIESDDEHDKWGLPKVELPNRPDDRLVDLADELLSNYKGIIMATLATFQDGWDALDNDCVGGALGEIDESHQFMADFLISYKTIEESAGVHENTAVRDYIAMNLYDKSKLVRELQAVLYDVELQIAQQGEGFGYNKQMETYLNLQEKFLPSVYGPGGPMEDVESTLDEMFGQPKESNLLEK